MIRPRSGFPYKPDKPDKPGENAFGRAFYIIFWNGSGTVLRRFYSEKV